MSSSFISWIAPPFQEAQVWDNKALLWSELPLDIPSFTSLAPLTSKYISDSHELGLGWQQRTTCPHPPPHLHCPQVQEIQLLKYDKLRLCRAKAWSIAKPMDKWVCDYCSLGEGSHLILLLLLLPLLVLLFLPCLLWTRSSESYDSSYGTDQKLPL